MFVSKKNVYPKVLKGYKNLLVETRCTRMPPNGIIKHTYTFSHPVWKYGLRLSISKIDERPWNVTLEGSFSPEVANLLLSPMRSIQINRVRITNNQHAILNFWDEASIVASSEMELLKIMKSFVDFVK